MCREYVSAFVYFSSTDCPSTEAATSTQIGTAILISHVFVLPLVFVFLHFHMLFYSLYYFFRFLFILFLNFPCFTSIGQSAMVEGKLQVKA
jgi:hypothetical protein